MLYFCTYVCINNHSLYVGTCWKYFKFVVHRIMSISGSRSIDESFLCFLLKHRALHHAPAICAVHQIWAYELLPYKFAVVERFLFESYDILVSGVSSPNQESDIKKLWRQNILYSHIYIYVDVGVTFAVKFLNLYKVSSILKFLYQEKNINFAFAIRQTAQDAWNKYQSLRCKSNTIWICVTKDLQ